MNWQELQDSRMKEYQAGVEGFFNTEGRGVRMVKKMTWGKLSGMKALDIGCGVLKYPAYMTREINWHGIDPLEGKRDFPFKQGVAENLPYPDDSFDGVLFSTSLDHVKDPEKAVSEALRVLKPSGYMFIWSGVYRNNKRYRAWKAKGGFIDKHHQLAFTLNDLDLLTGIKRIKNKIVRIRPLRIIKGHPIAMIITYKNKKNEIN